MKSVSYTHLDVYKRQYVRCPVMRPILQTSVHTSAGLPVVSAFVLTVVLVALVVVVFLSCTAIVTHILTISSSLNKATSSIEARATPGVAPLQISRESVKDFKSLVHKQRNKSNKASKAEAVSVVGLTAK